MLWIKIDFYKLIWLNKNIKKYLRFSVRAKHRKILSTENGFLKNDFPETILRWKPFYIETNGAQDYEWALPFSSGHFSFEHDIERDFRRATLPIHHCVFIYSLICLVRTYLQTRLQTSLFDWLVKNFWNNSFKHGADLVRMDLYKLVNFLSKNMYNAWIKLKPYHIMNFDHQISQPKT
jgi:hypothetical protein